MSGPGVVRRRRALAWGTALMVVGLAVVLVGLLVFPSRRPGFFAGKHVSETLVCEPSVREVALAYVGSSEAPLTIEARETTLARARAVLARLPETVRVTDLGFVQNVPCPGPVFPSRADQLTVLVVEEDGMQRLSTLHFDPARSYCRPSSPSLEQLDGFLVAQALSGQLRELNSDMFQLWAANLPRVASPSCRGGFALPGANHVDPRHAHVVQSVRNEPPSVGDAR